MNKKIVLAAVLAMASSSVIAAPNVGGCGWGSKLFDGQKGLAPQVLAVTTNGTSGNQTFGITTGSSGCTQDGVVKSNWAANMFIDGNKGRLARDMSRGQGESLDALAKLLGISDQHKAGFVSVAKENFARIFPSEEVTTKEIVVSLKAVLEANKDLATYSSSLS